ALIHDGTQWTYGEVAQRVDRLGGALTRLGIQPGDRIAYLGPNHPAFVETMFATMAIGAIVVPLDTRPAAPQLAPLLRDAEVRAFVWADQLDAVARAVLDLVPTELRVVVGAGSPAADHTLEQLIDGARPVPLDSPVSRDDVAMIMYTSGTTGDPRGVVLTHD